MSEEREELTGASSGTSEGSPEPVLGASTRADQEGEARAAQVPDSPPLPSAGAEAGEPLSPSTSSQELAQESGVPGEGARDQSAGGERVSSESETPEPKVQSKAKRKRKSKSTSKAKGSTALFPAKLRAKRRGELAWQEAEEEAERLLESLGLSGKPLPERIARRMAELEYERAWLQRFCEQKGRTTGKGQLKDAYTRLLDLGGRDLVECRRLLDLVAELTRKGDVEREEAPAVLAFSFLPGIDSEGQCAGCGRPVLEEGEEEGDAVCGACFQPLPKRRSVRAPVEGGKRKRKRLSLRERVRGMLDRFEGEELAEEEREEQEREAFERLAPEAEGARADEVARLESEEREAREREAEERLRGERTEREARRDREEVQRARERGRDFDSGEVQW